MEISKNNIKLLFLVLLTMMTYSCGKESPCFKSTGDIVVEHRSISSDINTIDINDDIDLIITQSNEPSLIIEAGENLMPYIKTELEGNELKIFDDNRCAFLRNYKTPVTARIGIKQLKRINYAGQGNISSNGILDFDKFEFETWLGTGSVNLSIHSNDIAVWQHTGSMDITFTGTADKIYLFSGGNGWMFFDKMIANDVHTNNDGAGDILVYAKNNLLVELTSLGNIVYYGNPSVSVSVHSGSGVINGH